MLQQLKNLDFKDTADSEDTWRNKVLQRAVLTLIKLSYF